MEPRTARAQVDDRRVRAARAERRRHRSRPARRGDHYVLNGTKTFSSNAPVADVFAAFATVDKAKGFMGVTGFILERGMPGLSVGPHAEKMGLRTSPMGDVILEDCVVSAE